MEEESWIEKFVRLLQGEGFISLLGRIADNFGKERISPWNIGVDTCIKINIFDPARSYICNNILPRANVPPKFSRILLTSHSFYD